MNKLDKISKKQINPNIPEFRVGDTVKVDYKIKEGNRERIQSFEGLVVSRKGGSVSERFTVRKISQGIGVERIYPVNSPRIEKLEVIKKGKVRRVKLGFLKKRKGTYKISERR